MVAVAIVSSQRAGVVPFLLFTRYVKRIVSVQRSASPPGDRAFEQVRRHADTGRFVGVPETVYPSSGSGRGSRAE